MTGGVHVLPAGKLQLTFRNIGAFRAPGDFHLEQYTVRQTYIEFNCELR